MNQISELTNTEEFLAYLRGLDVHLTADDGYLACTAPKGVLTPELRRELKSRKPEILDFFRDNGTASGQVDVFRPRTNGAHAATACIHEWFEEQAARTPDALALVCGDDRLTYRDLSLRSNRLANRLRAMGVGREVLTGICLSRSAGMVIALLAVLKAGGAYVPLDPQFPRERLSFMLEDSGVEVLVSEEHLLELLPGKLAVICLDRDRRLIERESADPPAAGAAPENLAYVIYTSGSTGKPKGVEIEHRAVVNLLSSMRADLGISDRDRLLAVTTLSFDIAALEIYLPLIAGAQLTIAPREAVVDGAALARLLRDSGATMMQATPVTWRLLLDSGWEGKPHLKILCGGEALTRELANRLLATGNELWNLYGPTETTIWSTIHRVDARPGPVPIGQPIANTRVYVLDEGRKAVPYGVAGELYIGGDGLARGYLRRPETTAARFVADPFRPGERLYRTGDLVRRLPDGNLEYLGREDQQIKLRGFRIELGEIEAVLEQQPGVRQAVVSLREVEPGDQRLTAYVISALPGDAVVLREALAAKLPEYMVPSAFVFLDAFPLTPNKKVDRKALPAPVAPAANCREHAASDTENRVAAIWRTLLEVPEVASHDDFFALGGHSLLIVALQRRISHEFSRELSIAELFQRPTVAGIAEMLGGPSETASYPDIGQTPKWNCLIPAQTKGARPPLFFVAGFQSPDDTLLILSRIIPHLGSDQPVYGLRPRWVEGNREAYPNVEEAAREYVAELRTVQPRGPYLLGGYCVGGVEAFEMARLLLQAGEKVGLLALVDTERPTALRAFLGNVWFAARRWRHMFDVLSEVVRSDRGSRLRALSDLLHRKLRTARPSEADDLLPEDYYRAKTNHRRLIYRYSARPYPGRITLLVNEKQYRIDKEMGWKGIPRDGLVIHRIPGDHLTLQTQRGKDFAELLRECIDHALSEHWLADRKGVDAS